jgi:histidinol-phosphatase
VTFGRDLQLARELADIADRITTAYERKAGTLHIERKADDSPVTEVDRAVESALRRALRVARPDDAFLGEEGGGPTAGAGAERRWIIDPIDGTQSYVSGGSDWLTYIALEVNQRLEVAVISSAPRRRRWEATRGAGAWCNGRRLLTSDTNRLTGAAWSTYLGDDGTLDLDPIRRMRGASPDMRQPHSYTDVADGSIDLAFDLFGGEWDFAAPKLLVEEAGGRMTDLAGRDRIDTGEMLATNGHLHSAALGLIGHPEDGAMPAAPR